MPVADKTKGTVALQKLVYNKISIFSFHSKISLQQKLKAKQWEKYG